MPEGLALELAGPRDEPVRVRWASPPGGGFAEARDWRLDGELDWSEVARLRVVSAALPDNRGLILTTLRPAGAAGHGEEEVAAALVAGGEPEPVTEALLSVESGADGTPRRLAIELYAGPDSLPLRIAADVIAAERTDREGLARTRARLEVRLEGKRSPGTYEDVAPSERRAR